MGLDLDDGAAQLDLGSRARFELLDGSPTKPHRILRGAARLIRAPGGAPLAVKGPDEVLEARPDHPAIFGDPPAVTRPRWTLERSTWPPGLGRETVDGAEPVAPASFALRMHELDVAGRSSTARSLRPSGSSVLLLRYEEQDPARTGEVLIRASTVRTAAGRRLVNVIEAFDDRARPALLVRGHGRLVLRAGCRLEVSFESGYERTGEEAAQVRILAGYLSREPEPLEGAPARDLPPIQGPAGGVVSSETVTLLGVRGPGADRVAREVAAGLTQEDPTGVPEFTLLTRLPVSPEELLAVIPVHASRPGPAAVVRVGIGTDRTPDDASAGTRRLTVLPADPGEAPARFEAVGPDANGELPGGLPGYLFGYRRARAWDALAAHRARVDPRKEGPKTAFPLVSARWRVLGRAGLGLVLVAIVIYVAWRLRRFSAAAIRPCSRCHSGMERRRIGQLDPGRWPGVLPALADISTLADRAGATEFRQRVVAQEPVDAEGEPSGLSRVLVQSDWCVRCEEGFLRHLLVRRGRVIDETEVHYYGAYSHDILQELFEELTSRGVVS